MQPDRLKEDLVAAEAAGLIAAGQADPLAAFLAARWAGSVSAPAGVVEEADLEMPRFVRGFHDILITIGIIIALLGLGGVATSVAALVAIIPLAEVLVRRQRLALPAFALTVATLIAGGLTIGMLDEMLTGGAAALSTGRPLLYLAGYAILLSAFYWRYRVPVALAALIASALFFGVAALLAATVHAEFLGSPQTHAAAVTMALFGFAGAFIGFAIALRFDLQDPRRISRRSDIAFWLHLAAAPALLYSLLMVLALLLAPDSTDGFGVLPAEHPVASILVIALFVFTGLIIDRRAFVTSGLISLGLSIAALFREGLISADMKMSTVLLAVGMIVLVIGVFWAPLRRLVVTPMPAGLKERLPPLRA